MTPPSNQSKLEAQPAGPMAGREVTMDKLTPGLKVVFTRPRTSAAGWMTPFFNQIGIVERRCAFPTGAWTVRFGGSVFGLYPDEVEEVKA